MHIEEIAEARTRLEEEIKRTIETFQEQTGANVDSITIDSVDVQTYEGSLQNKPRHIFAVKVTCGIP